MQTTPDILGATTGEVVPIDGDFEGKDFISMHQLGAQDIGSLLAEASAADRIVNDPDLRGINLLPFVECKVVMRQPSTRTGGSMATAMAKLGGSAQVISGMKASSEGKGESPADSWVAYATQADIIATRTESAHKVAEAATEIRRQIVLGNLDHHVPFINLGDGTNEHPTQAMGDLFTIYKNYGRFDDLTVAIVGDHERYRAHHSLMIGAATVGMNVIAVESETAPVLDEHVQLLGDRLERTSDLDGAMQHADVLYMGRNPDEYDGKDEDEKARSTQLSQDYKSWIVDYDRLQQMSPDAIVMHPRPRKDELHPSVDVDARMIDVRQMRNMIPMRMAIVARIMGVSMQSRQSTL